MLFIAFAQSSAVVVSSNTNVNMGDELDCPTTNPGSSGAPSSREMLCTVLTIQAMFFALSYVLVADRLRGPDDRVPQLHISISVRDRAL
jgi:hypothetical protein